jgi:hypothetical protein
MTSSDAAPDRSRSRGDALVPGDGTVATGDAARDGTPRDAPTLPLGLIVTAAMGSKGEGLLRAHLDFAMKA